MTKNKSREEVEQSYQEGSYEEVEPPKSVFTTGDFTITWNGLDVTGVACTDHFPKYTSPPLVHEREDMRCPYNDCGWCYYRGDGNSNDINGACNNAETCEVNNED